MIVVSPAKSEERPHPANAASVTKSASNATPEARTLMSTPEA
jgi:hypothetical protein